MAGASCALSMAYDAEQFAIVGTSLLLIWYKHGKLVEECYAAPAFGTDVQSRPAKNTGMYTSKWRPAVFAMVLI